MATENPQSYATFMAMSHASPRLTTNTTGDCVGRGQGLVILLRPETDSVNPLHAYLCNPHA